VQPASSGIDDTFNGKPKYFGVTTLTFWGHVTSPVKWAFDSQWATSYGWPIVTMRLSGTVIEIWRLKDNGVTTWPFGVTWRHRSRDHWTRHMRFPIRGPL